MDDTSSIPVPGRRIPGSDPAYRVLPVRDGRGRGHALLRAAIPQADLATRGWRDPHYGGVDAGFRHEPSALQVSYTTRKLLNPLFSPLNDGLFIRQRTKSIDLAYKISKLK